MVAALVLAALLATSNAQDQIAVLEKESGGKIGLAALDSASGEQVTYRPNERFRLCSTFKFLAAGAILKTVDDGKDRLDRFISYGKEDLIEYAPVTREHVNEGGMKLGALCAAALQQSDNTAGNLLLRQVGGPAGLTNFLRSIGDPVTRLDRTEPELNLGAPGDARDTTTPAAMCADLQRLLTGKVLSESSRTQLQVWIAGNTTGAEMIRAGVPNDWKNRRQDRPKRRRRAQRRRHPRATRTRSDLPRDLYFSAGRERRGGEQDDRRSHASRR